MSVKQLDKPKEHKKGNAIKFSKHRTLIFYGSTAMRAYEPVTYRALYDWISKHVENKDRNIFDIIAGTLIGIINGAIILSNFLNKKKTDVVDSLTVSEYWKDSADELEKFWVDIQTKYFFTDSKGRLSHNGERFQFAKTIGRDLPK